MLTLDKKTILKEIEVLIRSIKVHYDNIENEHRIPTIELELITSKIRKLHEKSIIYNHLHYLEEESSMMQKRERNLMDVMGAMNQSAAKTVSEISASVVLPDTSKEVSETSVDAFPAVKAFELMEQPPAVPLSTPEIVVSKPAIESAPPSQQVKPMDLTLELGLNDRFWFINELFSGKSEELDLALNNFSNTPTHVEARNFLEHLNVRFSWNRESEAYQGFISLLNKRFKGI